MHDVVITGIEDDVTVGAAEVTDDSEAGVSVGSLVLRLPLGALSFGYCGNSGNPVGMIPATPERTPDSTGAKEGTGRMRLKIGALVGLNISETGTGSVESGSGWSSSIGVEVDVAEVDELSVVGSSMVGAEVTVWIVDGVEPDEA